MTEENKEQPGSQSSEASDLSVKENFQSASLEQKEAFLKENSVITNERVSVDQDVVQDSEDDTKIASSEEKSPEDKTTDEQDSSSENKEEQSKPESETESSTESDKQGKLSILENRFAKMEKSYKNLEAEFTRKSQRLKKLETENDVLREFAKSGDDKGQKSEHVGTDEMKLAIVEEMKKDNPEAAKMFGAFGEQIFSAFKKYVGQDIESLKQNLVQEKSQTNISQFNKDVEEFKNSPLAPLVEKVNEILDREFPTDEELVTAITSAPNFFGKIKDKVIAQNYKLAAELETKAETTAGEVDNSKRDAEIERTKGMGKGNTSKPKPEDLMESKKFNKLSLEEKEKLLKQKGLFRS